MTLRHELHSARRRTRVQAESPFRFSPEQTLAKTDALVHAARLGQALQRALHTTIHESTASTRAIATHVQVSYQFLCNAANDSIPSQLPLLRLPLVLEASDDLTLLRFFAALQRAEVIRLPVMGAADDLRQASATLREFAEFMEAGAGALEDRRVTPAEFADIEREGQEAVRAILALVAHYRVRVERPLLEGM